MAACNRIDQSRQRGKKKFFFITGVDRGAGDVVERQRRVHVVDVAQQVEEVQVVLQADAGALFGVPAPKYIFFKRCPSLWKKKHENISFSFGSSVDLFFWQNLDEQNDI